MSHTEELARSIQKESQYAEIGNQIIEALYKDQHDLYHDAEFWDGCAICDKEREDHPWGASEENES